MLYLPQLHGFGQSERCAMIAVLRNRLYQLAKALLPRRVRRTLKYGRQWLQVRTRYGTHKRGTELVMGTADLIHPKKTVLFYPELPLSAHVVFKLCVLLGFGMEMVPENRFDYAFRQLRGTHTEVVLDRVPVPADQIVNAWANDVSKHHVAEAFEEVFGYTLEVDPTTYTGQMVEKSDENARHDGHLVQGPLDPEEI
ncbi:MAG: hypothetical protein R3284_10505, partial [Rubricoccaceae bacterium]|nr:hypothetical protein [Rubricoccaceae bacterium]